MGSPISLIVTNLYMKNFEVKAISTAPHPLISGRDMLMTPSPSSSHQIEELSWITSIPLTSIYNLLVMTKEKMDPCLSFDILVMPNEDGSLSTTVYRKSTHTDLYLHWDSHNTLPSKYSVIAPCTMELKPSAQTPNC